MIKREEVCSASIQLHFVDETYLVQPCGWQIVIHLHITELEITAIKHVERAVQIVVGIAGC